MFSRLTGWTHVGRRPPVHSLHSGRSERSVLWLGLVALFALHLGAAISGAWWLWGFGTLRYLPVEGAVAIGLVWALALIPPVGRKVEPWLARCSNETVWLALAGVLVVALPDRMYFLGDWLMRRGSVALDVPLDPLFPQALPLDLLLHVEALRPLARIVGVDGATRIAGGIEAMLFVGAAIAFSTRFRSGPAAAASAAAVAIAAGYLQLFTGYNKAACEMTVLVAAAMALVVASPRSAVATMTLGVVVGLGLLLHRIGILLIPALLVAVVVRSTHPHPSFVRRWLPSLVAVSLPALALMLTGSEVWRLLLTFDLPRHVASVEVPGSSLLERTLAPRHLLDLVNALGVLSPIAPVVLILFPRWLGHARRDELALLLSVVLPLVAALLIVHPQQGIFRDLDVLAPGAVAVGLMAARIVDWVLEDERRPSGVAVAVVVSCLASTIGWMAVHHDPERGARFVRSFTDPAAGRPARERALTWDFLGLKAMDAGDWPAAAHAWREATKLAPSPRMLALLAMSETMLGNLDRARQLFRRSLELDPGMILALRGIASTSFRLGDYGEARRAAQELRRRGASPPELRDLMRELDRVDGHPGPVRPS